MQAIGFVTPSLGWVGGRGFSSRETTDGGTTWTGVGTPAFQVLNRFQFFGDTVGYASGSFVWKYDRNGGSTSVGRSDASRSLYPVELSIRNPDIVDVTMPALFDVCWITLYDSGGRVLRSFEKPMREGNGYALSCSGLPRGPVLVVIGTATDVLFSTTLR